MLSMKTKIVQFDIEVAKKIQTGEITGKILYNKAEAEIIDFDLHFNGRTYICAKVKENSERQVTRLFDIKGDDAENSSLYYSLKLEVIDNEPKFKPFDKVLVRDNDDEEWEASYFSHIRHMRNDSTSYRYIAGNLQWKQCIPYEGNENLVGMTNKPNEV